MAVEQIQARMACHGMDAHAMTWDQANDLAHVQDVAVWVAAQGKPPMTQESCEADSLECRHGDGGKGGSSSSGGAPPIPKSPWASDCP